MYNIHLFQLIICFLININICLLTATIGHIIVQTIQTKMPICVSYLTNTMPIIGGGGGDAASFLQMPMENTGCHSGNIYADI